MTQHFVINGLRVCIPERDDIWMPTVFGLELAQHVVSIVRPGHRVLDLGCGSGIQSVVAALLGATVVGLDLNQAALAATLAAGCENGVWDRISVRPSNLFSAVEPMERFDLIVSNPPTFPASPPEVRQGRLEWEYAGENGRFMLDACLEYGHGLLAPSGSLLVIATSTQSWRLTKEKLRKDWQGYRLLEVREVPLASHYDPFIDRWIARGQQIGEELIFSRQGTYHQRLYFVQAW